MVYPRTRLMILAAAVGLTLIVCSDDDTTGGTQTLPPDTGTSPPTASTATPPTTSTQTTPEPTTVATAPTTTAIPTTTLSIEDQTKAEIEAEYLVLSERNWDLVSMPRLRNLELRAADRDSGFCFVRATGDRRA